MFEVYVLPVVIFAGLGTVAGVLLTVATKVFEVKVDERLSELESVLPGINCGACGFSGCSSYAGAILNSGAKTNLCLAGGDEASAKISEIMGVATLDVSEQTAFIHCCGDCNATATKYIFQGVQTCLAANRFYNGSEVCTHGCLGFGDCAVACPKDAITIKDNLAYVDKSKCVGCGLCVKACPNSLITVQGLTNFVSVACSSTDIGKITKSVCKNGCIGCKICEKKCKFGAIKVENNFAKIDYSLCTSCGECVAACPTKAIKSCHM